MKDYSSSAAIHCAPSASSGGPGRSYAITPDETLFELATLRLRAALDRGTGSKDDGEIAAARLELRALAVKMRDSGYWRHDKAGLRATVALLWEADRYVSNLALNGGATNAI